MKSKALTALTALLLGAAMGVTFCGPVICRDDPARSEQNGNCPRRRRGEYGRRLRGAVV